MSSDVDICNLALARLGNKATVASINPPDQSTEAQHCARFYPIARNSVLELYPWSFATQRTALALLTQSNNQWLYTYAVPNGAVNLLAVLDPNAPDDNSAYPITQNTAVGGITSFANGYGMDATALQYTPQPFTQESLADGTQVILTNQPNAELRYTVNLTDAAKFSGLFVDTLSWYLASMLAGPIYKGDTGYQMGQNCLKVFTTMLGKATMSDANDRRVVIRQVAGAIAARA